MAAPGDLDGGGCVRDDRVQRIGGHAERGLSCLSPPINRGHGCSRSVIDDLVDRSLVRPTAAQLAVVASVRSPDRSLDRSSDAHPTNGNPVKFRGSRPGHSFTYAGRSVVSDSDLCVDNTCRDAQRGESDRAR
jgi:hypothetical protein